MVNYDRKHYESNLFLDGYNIKMRCEAKTQTKNRKRCRRKASRGSQYCQQHAEMRNQRGGQVAPGANENTQPEWASLEAKGRQFYNYAKATEPATLTQKQAMFPLNPPKQPQPTSVKNSGGPCTIL